jgi:hypothetical protein
MNSRVHWAKQQRTLVLVQAIGKQIDGGKSLREFSTLRTALRVHPAFARRDGRQTPNP